MLLRCLILALSALLASCRLTEPPERIRVLSFNLWVGGEAGGQPLSQTTKVIAESRADIAGLQETLGEEKDGVRQDSSARIAAALGWSRLDQGGGNAIITRFKIIEGTPQGWGARIETPSGAQLFVFNAHFMHTPYQPYQLLGIPYNDAPFIKTEGEAVRFALEARGKEVEGLLGEVRAALWSGIPILVTGDFNEPSHLDWTDAATKAGKCPLRVVWPSTKALAGAGLADAFRAVRPDEVRDRGNTWTPVTREDDPRDRHDRIDFVLAGAKGVAVRGAEVVGESAENADIVVAPYPSDHRAVVAEVEIAR